MDILKTTELENRKGVLLAARENIKERIEVKTHRGVYIIKQEYAINIAMIEIDYEIKLIDIELEKLTGINSQRVDFLNKAGE